MKKLLLIMFLLSIRSFAAPVLSDTYFVTQSVVTATTTSQQFLATNKNRKYLLVINGGSTQIYVKGASIHIANEGVIIPAGGNWEPYVVPMDSIWIKASSGTDTVNIQEGQ